MDKQQQAINDFLEHIPEGFLMANSQGRIIRVNGRLAEMFGYHDSDLTGQLVELLVPAALREMHREHRQNYGPEAKPRAMGSGLDLRGRRGES